MRVGQSESFDFLFFLVYSQKVGRRVGYHLFKNETAAVGRRVSLFSAVQAVDVPGLVMCPCRRGATSPASQIQEPETESMTPGGRSATLRVQFFPPVFFLLAFLFIFSCSFFCLRFGL